MKTEPTVRPRFAGDRSVDPRRSDPRGLRRSCFRLLLGVIVGCCLTSLRAQTLTQTITLQPGRNVVFLEITPADPTIGNVFSDPAIVSVWEPKVRVSTVEFIQDPNAPAFNRGGWAMYVPTNRVESLNNDLFSVAANHAYIVTVGGASPVTVAVSGRPSLRALPFAPDAYTLRGLPVDPAVPTGFLHFFAASPAHGGATLTPIYRLDQATGNWGQVGPNDPIARGAAYWIYTTGSSSYQGSLSATTSLGDGLDFGLASEEQDLKLQNNTAGAMTVTLSDLGIGGRPLVYYSIGATNPLPAWLPLPQTYTIPLAAGATRQVRLGIQRSQMTADTYGTVLAVSDGQGTLHHVAVTAQRPAPSGSGARLQSVRRLPADGPPAAIPVALQAGLWVGDVTVNAVAETYNNATNPTPTKGAFDLRVILHVTPTGATRLLREVIQMYQNGTYTTNSAGQRVVSQPGQTVLLTDDTLVSQYTGVALRDGTPVGRRISTAGFDFDPPGGTNFLAMTGTFGISNVVGCTITLLPSTPTNPFLHRYHPDHDNLDAFFNPIGTNQPPEVYTVTRQIQLTFTGTDPAGLASTDYGYNEIGGLYDETITGLHRNPLVTHGIFHLRRVVNAAFLNQNQ